VTVIVSSTKLFRYSVTTLDEQTGVISDIFVSRKTYKIEFLEFQLLSVNSDINIAVSTDNITEFDYAKKTLHLPFRSNELIERHEAGIDTPIPRNRRRYSQSGDSWPFIWGFGNLPYAMAPATALYFIEYEETQNWGRGKKIPGDPNLLSLASCLDYEVKTDSDSLGNLVGFSFDHETWLAQELLIRPRFGFWIRDMYLPMWSVESIDSERGAIELYLL
jgi:hypothetical protein